MSNILKRRNVTNLRAYFDCLRAEVGLPMRAPVPRALQFLHRPKRRKAAA